MKWRSSKMKIEEIEKMKELKKRWDDYEFTFIRTNYYEKINHLISDWSSNWKNNNFNLRIIIKNNKENAMTRVIAFDEQYKNRITISLSKLTSFEFLINRKQLRIKIDENRQQYYKQYQIFIKERVYNSNRMRTNDSFNQRRFEIMKT
jgi:pantothenate kinase-related protein Tda10